MKYTGINGIEQATETARRAETERLAAVVDYIAMMSDIEIPTDETEDTENE